MASNLSCVGLGVADGDSLESLLATVRPHATPLGTADGLDVVRWEDASSGARLVVGIAHGEVVDLLPSLTSPPDTRLAGVRSVNHDVVTAAVVDQDGEQVTSLSLELEERRLLGARVVERADAAIVALARSVALHDDADVFEASRGSLLDPDADTEAEPPPFFGEGGLQWPPRMAPESFISYGVFADPDDAGAMARLNGVVIGASRRTTALTGQSFTVARVRTAGFEVDVCLSAEEHPEVPRPGQVLGGEVFLVGSAPAIAAPTPRTRWWRRR
jgi:hypothetical protein